MMEDSHLYLGIGETRGLACVSHKLLEFVTEELHKESIVLKERRKLKEERQASRPAGPGSSGGDERDPKAAAQSTIDKQKAEIARLKAQITGGDGPAKGQPGKKGGGRGAGAEGG